MLDYQFFCPTRLSVNFDVSRQLPSFILRFGKRPLILSLERDRFNPLFEIISAIIRKELSNVIVYWDIGDSVKCSDLDTISLLVKDARVDVIVGIGNEFSLGLAKMVGVLGANRRFCFDFFSEDGSGDLLPPIPVVLFPFNPVFGMEVLPDVFILEEDEDLLAHLRRDFLFPSITVIDPDIYEITGEFYPSYLGAVLSTAIEALIAEVTNEFVNTMSMRAIDLIRRNSLLSMDKNNKAARYGVALSSLFSGMAMSNSILGVCYAVGLVLAAKGRIPLPLGISMMLPLVMEHNLTNLATKYVQIAKAFGEDVADITVIEAAIKAIEAVRKLFLELKIPQRFSELGLSRGDIPIIAELASKYMFLRNLRKPVSKDKLETLLIAGF